MDIKDRIVDEASKLFFQNGIKSITMSDIAAHMGISKRTLYEVFKDKEELLKNCIRKSIEKGNAESTQLLSESENVIDAMMRIYAKNLNEVHKMNKSVIHDLRKYHPQIYKMIEERQKAGVALFIPLFEKGVQQGLMRNDINFIVLLWLLKAQFKMLLEDDFIPTDEYPINEFVRAIILNFVRGIATEKGNKKIDEMISKLDQKLKENK